MGLTTVNQLVITGRVPLLPDALVATTAQVFAVVPAEMLRLADVPDRETDAPVTVGPTPAKQPEKEKVAPSKFSPAA